MRNNSKFHSYNCIKEKCSHEEKVKSSKFIATAAPVNDVAAANEFIAEIKKKFHDASHNCSAYRIGKGKSLIFKYSDDGEPSGTAGAPILKAIEKRELSDICVVVTRYFGGTKLGTGGLSRAYGQSTSELLKKCEVEKKYELKSLEFRVEFDFVGVVHNILEKFKVDIKDSQYGDDVLFIVDVRLTSLAALKEKLTEATNGQIRFR